MVASSRRRWYRLQTGGNRKWTVIRWIGETTVGVVNTRLRLSRNQLHVKADEGAEKSCRCRRRKRGLRKGKCRSRGRQPRELRLPPPQSKEPTERTMNRLVRQIDFWASRVDQFSDLISKADKRKLELATSRCLDDKYESTDLRVYKTWEVRYGKLLRRIPEGLRGATGIGACFSFYLANRFGINDTSLFDLREMLGSIQHSREQREFEILKERLDKQRSKRRVYFLRCWRCKERWSSEFPTGLCPQCGLRNARPPPRGGAGARGPFR